MSLMLVTEDVSRYSIPVIVSNCVKLANHVPVPIGFTFEKLDSKTTY